MVSENILFFAYVEHFIGLDLEIVNSVMNWVKGIKIVLAQANEILNQALNIHIFKTI